MKHTKPLILVTNDDGINAPGIRNLVSIMHEIGEVFVVAPDRPQSGMGHAITINSTLRIQKIKLDGEHTEYSCSGTPVDCIKMAINKLMPRKPDLIVSGINHGSNSSINVIYSGTMSAAVEGAIEDIPSIGFSLCNHSIDADFKATRGYVRNICLKVLAESLPSGVCLNVNFPDVKAELIAGVKVCRQAKAMWVEDLEERMDPSGKPYYWLTGYFKDQDHKEDTDEWALKHNYISVVPVHIDFTAYHAIEKIKQWNLE
jgi:5'-nucleotidase